MKQPYVSVVLLAGGSGTRMQGSLPKQYLPLQDKPVVLHSLHVFQEMPEVAEIIVVCDPQSAPSSPLTPLFGTPCRDPGGKILCSMGCNK